MKTLIYCTAVMSLTFGQVAIAATPAAPVKPVSQGTSAGACASLKEDYGNLSKDLAQLVAKSIGDNSAPREQIRQMQRGNDYAKASVILTLMGASKCQIPTYAPDEIYFTTAAMKCQTADLDWQLALMNKTNVDEAKSKMASACAWSTWETGPQPIP